MKKIILISSLCAVALVAVAENYFTKSASGSTSCQVNFPAIAGSQGRIAGVVATSDKAASVLSMRSGVAAYSPTVAAALTATNIAINATNGLALNDLVIIQQPDGTMTNLTVYNVTSYTNLNLTTAIGVAVTTSSTIYKLGAATTVKVGATTAVYSSDALYAGNRGRPIRVVLDGTSACSLDSVTVKQD
jgi:hypothetical protein